MDFEQLLRVIAACTDDQKQRIFRAIREKIAVHPYEKKIGAPAEIILESIHRAGDFTQRGIRGMVAEVTFITQILPNLKGWEDVTKPGEFPFDALLVRNGKQVRVQVKTQRLRSGAPLESTKAFPNHWIVELQRTRGGTDAEGNATRPYRFAEFDLLAVCLWGSSGNWKSFLYAPARLLIPDPNDETRILKMQPVPKTPTAIWTDNLQTCLDTHFLGKATKPSCLKEGSDTLPLWGD